MKRLSSLAFATSAMALTLTFAGSGPAFEAKAASTTANSHPTAKDIADAKAKGNVWLGANKIYHKPSDKYYGTTNNGSFMSEAAAQKLGGHAAKPAAPKTKATK
jgi:hypothetical protein